MMNEETVKKKKISIKQIIILQCAVCIYTASGVFAKYASGYKLNDFLIFIKCLFTGTLNSGNFSFKSIGLGVFYALEILVLGIYAIIWQQIIKKVDLSIAYSNRAVAVFWSALWAVTIFGERITVQNIIGIIIIVFGTWLVNKDG